MGFLRRNTYGTRRGEYMQQKLAKDLTSVKKSEEFQEKMITYVTSVGKWLMYILPILLVGFTILSFLIGPYFLLNLIFFIFLGIYGLNAIFLLLGAISTEISLDKRIQYERKRGRPIESLDGFEILSANVNRVLFLLKIVTLLCFASLTLYVMMLLINELELGFAATGLTLFGFGLALLIRSLNLNLNDINGLQEFYKPSMHKIRLDQLMTDIVSNHLDPITYLKWDEFVREIKKRLSPEFRKKIKQQDVEDDPITFAIEKLLFSYYLLYQGTITKELFEKDIKTVLNLDSFSTNFQTGLKIEGKQYFSKNDIFQIFDYIKKYNISFFKLIDRLQLELTENIKRLAQDPIYMDSCSEEVVYKNGELNIMTFLYNNRPEAKDYTIEITAPGFAPNHLVLDLNVEGRGRFEIPQEQLPLISEEETDITGVMSNILENGDATWVTLEPRKRGTQTIQIWLETPEGTIIEGETKTVKITRDLKQKFKTLISGGSLLGGIAVPIFRLMPILSPSLSLFPTLYLLA